MSETAEQERDRYRVALETLRGLLDNRRVVHSIMAYDSNGNFRDARPTVLGAIDSVLAGGALAPA